MEVIMKVQVAKINKRDFEAKVAEFSRKFKIEVGYEFGEEKVLYTTRDNQGRKMEVRGWDVEVFANDDKLAAIENTGWNYLGSFQEENGAIIIVPSRYATYNGYELSSIKDEIEGFPCHECGRKIRRTILHIFEKDGQIKPFGSGCAQKKFGVNFLSLISRYGNFMNRMEELPGDDYGYFCSVGNGYYLAKDWFEVGYYLINKYGYVSSSKASYTDETSTNDTLADYYRILFLIGKPEHSYQKEIQDKVPAEMEAIDMDYDAFIEFAEKFVRDECSGDFAFNLETALDVMKEGYVIPKLAGYLVYVIFKFWKSNNTENVESFNEDYSDLSEGQKIKKLLVKIVDKHVFEGYYGPTNIYTMKGADDGRKYKWFTAKNFSTGTELAISSCSIKKLEDHAIYGKSVVLTRCYAKAK
jgi:hypothetical protein